VFIYVDLWLPFLLEIQPQDLGLNIWFPQQISVHAGVIRADAKGAITKFPENGSRPEVPTGPGQRGISIHVFGVFGCPCIQQQLDGFLNKVAEASRLFAVREQRRDAAATFDHTHNKRTT